MKVMLVTMGLMAFAFVIALWFALTVVIGMFGGIGR